MEHDAAGRSSRATRWSLIAGYLLWAVVYAGWWLHRSPPDARVLGPYSARYLLLLALTALPFAAPPLLALARHRLGPRRFRLWLATVGAGGLLLYGALALHRAWTQEHRFDPWLQAPPPAAPTGDERSGPRVLLLGGSTTEGAFLPPGERYADVLADLLRAARPDVVVHNGGRSWFTTRHTLSSYVTDLADWRPDVVVHMEAINDLLRSLEPDDFTLGPYDERWAHYYGPAIGGARPDALGAGLLRRLADDWCSELRWRPVDLPLEAWRSIPRAERHLRALVRRAKADGARVVIVTQPFFITEERHAEYHEMTRGHVRRRGPWLEHPSARSVSAGLALCAERARVVAREEQALLVDGERHVPKTLEHFRDEVHARAPGARLLAEEVARVLLGAGVLE